MSLQYDPEEAVRWLAAADDRMARLIEAAGPFTLAPRLVETPFQALMRAIINQQLSGKAAATIHGRVLALMPEGAAHDAVRLAELADEALRRAGVSRAKTLALKDLAARTLDGTVPTLDALQAMEDEAIIDRLVQVRGVGRWTVEMLLIFRLGRPDVLPLGDLGVRKGFMLTYGLPDLPSVAAVREHGVRWQPFRSVASWYLWRAVDMGRP